MGQQYHPHPTQNKKLFARSSSSRLLRHFLTRWGASGWLLFILFAFHTPDCSIPSRRGTRRHEEVCFIFVQTFRRIKSYLLLCCTNATTHTTRRTNERMHASESCVFSQLILSACFSSSLRVRSVIMFLVWFSPDVTFVWLADWLTCFAPRGMKIERILWKCCAHVDLKIF